MSGTGHRAALARLPEGALASLQSRHDGPALRHLALQIGMLIATGTGIMLTLSPWLLVPLVLAHGILLSFLFTAQHECVHGTAFRSDWLNDSVAECIGFLTMLPPRWFRYFHFAHHRHTQDPEHDPELAAPKPVDWPGYLWALTGVARWTSMLSTMLRLAGNGAPDIFVPPKAARKVMLEARIYLAAYAAVLAAGLYLSWSALFWLWLLPSLVGQPFLRAYLMAEHTACPLVPDMLINTRTTFATPLINWLAWNMPHHTAHHTAPTVPFHSLPRLTQWLRPALVSTANGYADAHRQVIRAWPRPVGAKQTGGAASK